MTIGELVASAFAWASQKYPQVHTQWTTISGKVGGRLPASLLMVDIQRLGSLDVLIRCMEDELVERVATKTLPGGDPFVGHYAILFSNNWVGGMYEIFRLLRQRGLADSSPAFAEIFSELELLRMPLEKYEIAKDKRMSGPLQFTKNPPRNDESDNYTYDKDDPLRGHIMPAGLSQRGSVMWQVIDHEGNARWIERRTLSDAILKLWDSENSPTGPNAV